MVRDDTDDPEDTQAFGTPADPFVISDVATERYPQITEMAQIDR